MSAIVQGCTHFPGSTESNDLCLKDSLCYRVGKKFLKEVIPYPDLCSISQSRFTVSNGKEFRVAAALKDPVSWESVGGKDGKNMQLKGKAGFRMFNDLTLNHLDFIVKATQARHSSWG